MVLIHCSSHFAHETIPADVYEILIISCSKEGGSKTEGLPPDVARGWVCREYTDGSAS